MTAEEKAKEIIQEMIDIEAWRDGLHVNDLPYLRSTIVEALSEAYEKGFAEVREQATKIVGEWFKIDRTKYGNPNPEFMDLLRDKINALKPKGSEE